MTLSERLSDFAAPLRFEDLPDDVVAAAKLHILDTVGACMASVGMTYAEAIRDMVGEQGTSTDATLFGSDRQTATASWAAFYNGSLAHGNDYDDTHGVTLIHISSNVLPAVLALGERHRLSGRAAITAVVAGYETALRIGMGAPAYNTHGFHATSVCGVFGAAVAAAHVLGLDAAQMTHAIGIAASQSSGLIEFFADGAWTKRMHPGWAAHAGIVAAQLAARGFTGPVTALEGRHGFYRAYAGVDAPDETRFLKKLGHEWETLNIDFKPYPCGHILHPYMDCARVLRAQHTFALADIEDIELRVAPAVVPILCEPHAEKIRPKSAYYAQFSLPYAIAAILMFGRAGIEEFSEEHIRNPDLLALAARVRYVADPSLPYPKAFPGWVKIRLRGGVDIAHRMDASHGSREHPMSESELRNKFTANVSRYLPPPAADKIWDAGMAFERARYVGDLIGLLTKRV